METVMEEGECLSQEECAWNEELDISQLCRICASPNEYLIPIFQGEGLEHDLKSKMAKHLPIKVLENDELPTNLCYQCASTLIAWHDMVVGCLEADEKLRTINRSRSGNNTQVTNKITSKNTSSENNINTQQNNEPLSRMNNTVYVSQDQDVNLIASAGTENVVDEEEISSIKHEMVEDETLNSRFLSFRNYQVAICALKEKLMNPKIKQLKHTRNINASSKPNLFISETLSSRKTRSKPSDPEVTSNVSCDEIFVKSKPQCHTCGRVFTRKYDLKRHGLIHLNADVFETVGSSSLDFNDKHLSSIPKTVITHTCEICCRVFKAKDSYERHKRIHTNEKPFHCNECGKCFRDSGALTRHTKEVHAKIRNHPCNMCNKWFMNRATLEDHTRTHTGERPYVCHQCGVMFKTRAALYQHGKTHTNFLPHICGYCDKCFRRRQELIAHLPIHTNERTHVCEKCGKTFSTRSELHRHIIVHSDEKPFACVLCSMNFSQKRYLKNHMKSRHGRTEDLQS